MADEINSHANGHAIGIALTLNGRNIVERSITYSCHLLLLFLIFESCIENCESANDAILTECHNLLLGYPINGSRLAAIRLSQQFI